MFAFIQAYSILNSYFYGRFLLCGDSFTSGFNVILKKLSVIFYVLMSLLHLVLLV